MLEALAGTLPIAVGIIVVPIPIVAVIVLLFSPRATTNGLSFLAGWIVGLTTVGALTLLLADGGNVDEGGASAQWATIVKLLLGVGLLFLAWRSFGKRPRKGEEPSPPAWMSAIDSFTPRRSFRLGLLLSAANPKNILLVAGAMTGVAIAGLPIGQEALVLIAFVAVCSLGVGVPLGYALLGGQAARDTLTGWKTWLVAHNAVVVALVLLVLGVMVVAQSLVNLAG